MSRIARSGVCRTVLPIAWCACLPKRMYLCRQAAHGKGRNMSKAHSCAGASLGGLAVWKDGNLPENAHNDSALAYSSVLRHQSCSHVLRGRQSTLASPRRDNEFKAAVATLCTCHFAFERLSP